MIVRLQSEDRAHRIGQKDKVTYIDIVCPKTIDEKIMETLNNKKKLADEITGDNWKELFSL
jgi:SNF2 family DNA or RNA helicase